MEYYLEVVKSTEKPKWPRPEEELVINSQELDSSFTQYWAYSKDSVEDTQALPHAEAVARENIAPQPVILIDKAKNSGPEDQTRENYLELILCKNGHAWAKTESSLENLEDNISSILEFAQTKFDLKVEHFMTTENVPSEVEKKLDEWEKNEGEEKIQPQEEHIKPVVPTRSSTPLTSPQTVPIPAHSSSKIWAFLPLIILIVVFAGALIFIKGDQGGQMINKLKTIKTTGLSAIFAPNPTPTPTPTPQLTPTPTPSLDRAKYKIRVLNGTTTTGAASALSEKLKALGWEVIKVGNNKDQTISQTLVKGKEDLSQAVSTISTDLLEEDLEATTSSNLTEADTADLEVVIGKK